MSLHIYYSWLLSANPFESIVMRHHNCLRHWGEVAFSSCHSCDSREVSMNTPSYLGINSSIVEVEQETLRIK